MKNLFLFTGEETYLLQEQINLWKKAFVDKHGDINLEELDVSLRPLNEIMAAVLALPFLGDKRLVFIHGLPEPAKTRSAGAPTKKDEKRDEELKRFAKDLDDVPESSVVVFVQTHPDRRRSFYKELLKKAELKEFNPLAGSALIQWIQTRVQSRGGRIDFAAAEYLVSLTGHNLWRLSTEIDKLTAYQVGGNLSRELMDQLVVPTIEANVFHLTDALGAKDSRKAMACLHRTLVADEKLQAVFYMMVRQFRLLLQGRSFLEYRSTSHSAEFGARLKLHPFVAKNTLSQAKNFEFDELKSAYRQLLEIDTGLKTSRIKVLTEDQSELALALERFILELCG